MNGLSRRDLLRGLGGGALLAGLAACSGGGGAPQTGPSGTGQGPIRVALDWTPNTNHTGLFVAQHNGWFRDAGLDVQLLPYNNTNPDVLVSSGAAEFGISFMESVTMSRPAGLDLVSVMAPVQHGATALAVRGDRTGIASPRDLDGLIYGGFGIPYEEPKIRATIRAAGGKGEFESMVLGTSAYDAVWGGKADFSESYVAWDGIEAELRGTPWRYFHYRDYGLPDVYQVVLIGNGAWLQANPGPARTLVAATLRGYQLGADDPDRAAQILIEAAPGAFTNPELPIRSQRMHAERFLRDEQGRVGTQTSQRWDGYARWAQSVGILAGPDGVPLTAVPDTSGWFTDSYLPSSP